MADVNLHYVYSGLEKHINVPAQIVADKSDAPFVYHVRFIDGEDTYVTFYQSAYVQVNDGVLVLIGAAEKSGPKVNKFYFPLEHVRWWSLISKQEALSA